MTCDTCNGKDPKCFRCDGGGELCDVCGEATHEAGMNICEECQRDQEEGDE
jgi:hypothetical protein